MDSSGDRLLGNPTADIPTFVVVAVLFSAGLHASWNALVKTTDDAFLRFALIDATGLVSSLAAVAFVPIPFGCWRYLGASAIIHIGYKAFLMWSYRSGDISLVYPIARGSAPLLVAIGGAAFVHEPLGVFGILGVGLVSLGVASIALRKERRGHPPSGARRCTADGRDHRRLHDRGWPRRPLRSDGVLLRGVALPPRRVGVPAVGARDAEVLAALVVRSAGAHRRARRTSGV